MDLFCFHILYLEHQICISDAIGTHIMIKEQTSIHLLGIVGQLCSFPFNVCSFQHRDALQKSRILLCFLIGFQFLCPFNHLCQFFFRQTLAVVLQLICQFFFTLCCQSFLWNKTKHRPMRILKQAVTDQLFKISLIYRFFQLLKNSQLLNLCKRLFITIQPVTHNVQSIHQALGIRTKVCFPVSELHIIDPCQDCFFIYAIMDDLT